MKTSIATILLLVGSAALSIERPVQAPSAIVVTLPNEPTPEEVQAAVELLLVCERPAEALALLRTHPRTGPWAYVATARAARHQGWQAPASELYVAALLRSIEDRDLLEEFASADPSAFLEFTEHADVLAVEVSRKEVVARLRGRVLQALGRSEEALELARPLERCIPDSTSDLVPGIWCERWEVEARLDVDPAAVEPALRRILDVTRDADALILMARLLHTRGRHDEWPPIFAAWRERVHDDDRTAGLLIELVPYTGWGPLVAFRSEYPGDWTAVFALADHLVGAGRVPEAQRILGELIDVEMRGEFDHDVVVEAVWRAPELLQQLVRRVEQLGREGSDATARSLELGRLGDVFWQLGEFEHADAAWSAALGVGSELEDLWRSHRRRARLGVPYDM